MEPAIGDKVFIPGRKTPLVVLKKTMLYDGEKRSLPAVALCSSADYKETLDRDNPKNPALVPIKFYVPVKFMERKAKGWIAEDLQVLMDKFMLV